MSKYQKIIKETNDLSAKEWGVFSKSIWSGIKKREEDKKPKHPASMPIELANRLLRCYSTPKDKWVLDPFVGKGTTLFAARELNKSGIGFDTNPEYINYARNRLSQGDIFVDNRSFKLYNLDSRLLLDFVAKESIDICITSPPYWDVLSQKRTVQNKAIKDYGNYEGDISQIKAYNKFIHSLVEIFSAVYKALKKGSYLIVNVMDIRREGVFIAYHSDISYQLKGVGFKQEDIIIWDKRNFSPQQGALLGYPYKFVSYKVHEYLLIFSK